jgi:hypothetical protein
MIAYIPLTIMIVILLIAVYCIIERQKVIIYLVNTFLPGYHLTKNRKKAKKPRVKKVEEVTS